MPFLIIQETIYEITRDKKDVMNIDCQDLKVASFENDSEDTYSIEISTSSNSKVCLLMCRQPNRRQRNITITSTDRGITRHDPNKHFLAVVAFDATNLVVKNPDNEHESLAIPLKDLNLKAVSMQSPETRKTYKILALGDNSAYVAKTTRETFDTFQDAIPEDLELLQKHIEQIEIIDAQYELLDLEKCRKENHLRLKKSLIPFFVLLGGFSAEGLASYFAQPKDHLDFARKYWSGASALFLLSLFAYMISKCCKKTESPLLQKPGDNPHALSRTTGPLLLLNLITLANGLYYFNFSKGLFNNELIKYVENHTGQPFFSTIPAAAGVVLWFALANLCCLKGPSAIQRQWNDLSSKLNARSPSKRKFSKAMLDNTGGGLQELDLSQPFLSDSGDDSSDHSDVDIV